MPWSRTSEYPHPFGPQLPMGRLYNYSSYVAIDQGLWISIANKLNAFRKNVLGLKAIDLSAGGSLTADKQVPHMYCWSPSVLPKPADWLGEYMSVTGYWYLERLPDDPWKPSKELQEFIAKEPKPIYIGFGSVNVTDPGKTSLFKHLLTLTDKLTLKFVKALQKTGQRAILMKSWGGSEDLNKYKDMIFCIDSVPHDWLFPQMKAVIHHGGAGTCGEGFRHGIPTMVLPFFGDQFLWASRIEELGVGLSPFPFKKMTTAKLTSSLDKLVNDPGTHNIIF